MGSESRIIEYKMMIFDTLKALQSNQCVKSTNKQLYCRMLANVLYDVPVMFTGWCSITAASLKVHDAGYHPVNDHFYSRMQGGEQLVNLLSNEIELSNVSLLVDQYRQVRRITKTEHELVSRHQKNCSVDAAYRRASIQMVYWPQLWTIGRRSYSVQQQLLDKLQAISSNSAHTDSHTIKFNN